MARLGSKYTLQMEDLLLSNQITQVRTTQTRRGTINLARDNLKRTAQAIEGTVDDSRRQAAPTPKQVLLYLEFSERDRRFFDSFSVPPMENNDTIVGHNGRPLWETDLLSRWRKGKDAGPLARLKSEPLYEDIWKMNYAARLEKVKQWKSEILHNETQMLTENIHQYSTEQNKLKASKRRPTSRFLCQNVSLAAQPLRRPNTHKKYRQLPRDYSY
jgi:hypothetical protein